MASAPSTDALPNDSLGSELERERLEHRARRLSLVVALLRERASSSSYGGTVPPGLQQAIANFSAELSRVRDRLHGEPLRDRLRRDHRPRRERRLEPELLAPLAGRRPTATTRIRSGALER